MEVKLCNNGSKNLKLFENVESAIYKMCKPKIQESAIFEVHKITKNESKKSSSFSLAVIFTNVHTDVWKVV